MKKGENCTPLSRGVQKGQPPLVIKNKQNKQQDNRDKKKTQQKEGGRHSRYKFPTRENPVWQHCNKTRGPPTFQQYRRNVVITSANNTSDNSAMAKADLKAGFYNLVFVCLSELQLMLTSLPQVFTFCSIFHTNENLLTIL